MVLLQVCLVKQRRGKSTQEGNFASTTARYNRGLIVAVGELPTEVEEEIAATSKGANEGTLACYNELPPVATSIDKVF